MNTNNQYTTFKHRLETAEKLAKNAHLELTAGSVKNALSNAVDSHRELSEVINMMSNHKPTAITGKGIDNVRELLRHRMTDGFCRQLACVNPEGETCIVARWYEQNQAELHCCVWINDKIKGGGVSTQMKQGVMSVEVESIINALRSAGFHIEATMPTSTDVLLEVAKYLNINVHAIVEAQP